MSCHVSSLQFSRNAISAPRREHHENGS